MKKERSSETAMQMAFSRAIDSLKTEEECICYDPLAKDFLTLKYKILIEPHKTPDFCLVMNNCPLLKLCRQTQQALLFVIIKKWLNSNLTYGTNIWGRSIIRKDPL